MFGKLLMAIGAVVVIGLAGIGLASLADQEVSDWTCNVGENGGLLTGGACADAVYICRNIPNCEWVAKAENMHYLDTNLSVDDLKQRIAQHVVAPAQ